MRRKFLEKDTVDSIADVKGVFCVISLALTGVFDYLEVVGTTLCPNEMSYWKIKKSENERESLDKTRRFLGHLSPILGGDIFNCEARPSFLKRIFFLAMVMFLRAGTLKNLTPQWTLCHILAKKSFEFFQYVRSIKHKSDEWDPVRMPADRAMKTACLGQLGRWPAGQPKCR